MVSIEDVNLLAVIAATPELASPDDTDGFLDAMPIPELASMWCALQRLSRRDQTPGAWAAKLYFDQLPHRWPDRALDLALEVLRAETDKPTVMQLNDKFMLALLYVHGVEMIDRIESEAEHNSRLRWLLGGIYFGPDEPVKSRIDAIADTKAYRRDERARRTPQHPLDCEAMSVPELARAWVEQYSKSERARDDNFFAIMDYERACGRRIPTRRLTSSSRSSRSRPIRCCWRCSPQVPSKTLSPWRPSTASSARRPPISDFTISSAASGIIAPPMN